MPARCSSLPDPRVGDDLIELMARRRTVRSAASPSIKLKQLSDCLFAGMGITGATRNVVGALPLGMTPSGGARNPYEAYVYARNVEGLAPGFYHYSAYDHDLALVATNRLPKPSELLGGQDWADEMPCVILLCASLERTMWKYDDPNAYRVVLIEAGHIGQNIMLAATSNGLSACPTAALNHATIRECVSLKRLTDAPIYALTLAVPGVEAGASPSNAAGLGSEAVDARRGAAQDRILIGLPAGRPARRGARRRGRHSRSTVSRSGNCCRTGSARLRTARPSAAPRPRYARRRCGG